MRGKLTVVGFGPGAQDHLTFRARQAIEEAEVVVGYSTYINLVRPLLEGKEVIRSGMQEEIGRARAAVEKAEEGRKVAVISSGDAGIYGMAGLVLEVLAERGWDPETGVEFEVVPGVTALSACAALVGAPIMHDFAAISLSDLLTPWEVILERLDAAARADFVIALYNPASGRRQRQVVEAVEVISRYRKPETPCALVKSAYRDRQSVVITDLGHVLDYEIGMLTTILVGNSTTYVYRGWMITPRGYANKYDRSGQRREGIGRWESLTRAKLEQVPRSAEGR
ncbi:MAG: precorrin-3B C(17)-methyltransferase [Chloroflexota bacterium]